MFYTRVESGNAISNCPPSPQRSFWYLGGKWEEQRVSEALSFYPSKPGESPVSPGAVPQSLHVTPYISHLLFCHSKSEIIFEFSHLLMQLLPANDQHSLSACLS